MPFTEQEKNRMKFGLTVPSETELKILEVSSNIGVYLRKNPQYRGNLEKVLQEIRGNKLYVRISGCEAVITALEGSDAHTPAGMRSADRVAKKIIVFILEAAIEESHQKEE